VFKPGEGVGNSKLLTFHGHKFRKKMNKELTFDEQEEVQREKGICTRWRLKDQNTKSG